MLFFYPSLLFKSSQKEKFLFFLFVSLLLSTSCIIFSVSLSNNVIFSILWLGVISRGIAFLGYVRLIEKVGAVKTATVAYFIPIFGVIWGYVFLDEPITLQILIGMMLILTGIIFTNKRYDQH